MSKRALTLEIDDQQIAWLTIDVPGASQNTLKPNFGPELDEILDELGSRDDVKALILQSGKPGTFLAGADIEMLRDAHSKEAVYELSKGAHRSFERLERLPIPTVTAIDGPCLGGGLELALATSWRVVTDNPKTKLGLPESMLGLLPGGGGTQRLPRLIGIANGLDMMLTGRELRAKRAKNMGLVDEVVAEANLRGAAIKAALRLAEQPRRRRKKRGVGQAILEGTPPGRALIFQQARAQLLKKTQGNYPAQERIIDAVEAGYKDGIREGYEAEARFFADLAFSPQAKALMTIFFAQTALKKDTGVSDRRFKPRKVDSVGVLGAGLMGAGIAWTSVERADVDVRLKDRDEAGVARGIKQIAKLYEPRIRRKQLSKQEAARQLARITTTTDYSGFSRSDIVIEAVFEDLDLKRSLLKEVEAVTGKDTIFATNTSSIPIHKIAEAASRPENVIGLHYFSPVEKMPLLEVVVTDKTSNKTIATSVEFGKRQGKTVIVVQDGAGFYTSRILAPYLNEAARLLSEDVAIDRIDKALVRFGFPVGPMTLLDEVGLDVGEKVAGIMVEAFGERMTPPDAMAAMIEKGYLGRKANKGFYVYPSKKKKPDTSIYEGFGLTGKASLDDHTIALRCTLLMVNEAVRCLESGILRSARDGDIGAIFGLGFPPFLGGPFRYIDARGAAAVVDDLNRFADKYGARFEPAELLLEHAQNGTKFHND